MVLCGTVIMQNDFWCSFLMDLLQIIQILGNVGKLLLCLLY